MFFSDDFDVVHNQLSNTTSYVGEIVKMPSGRVLNFTDNENNYFAIMETSN